MITLFVQDGGESTPLYAYCDHPEFNTRGEAQQFILERLQAVGGWVDPKITEESSEGFTVESRETIRLTYGTDDQAAD